MDAGGDPLRRSVMRFQTHLCWYLDATFCYYFHGFQEQGFNVCCYPVGGAGCKGSGQPMFPLYVPQVVLLTRVLLLLVFILAVCCAVLIAARAVSPSMSIFQSHDSEAEARREISRWSKARHSKPNVIERLSNSGIAKGINANPVESRLLNAIV